MAWTGRDVATRVRFPTIIIASGIAEPGWVSSFGGVASEPQSITVRYGHPWTAAEVDVTTYPGDPLDDLPELVASQAVRGRWAMTNRPAHPPPATTGEPKRRRTITISKVDQPSPEALKAERAQQRATRAALKVAGKRDTVMSIDGLATDAHVVELPGVAAVGLRLDPPQELKVVLVARAVDPESLELVSTRDLASHVGDPPVI
jgi:hypothetical protein